MQRYVDRAQAGIILVSELKAYANKNNAIVLALPRGGVPVAYEIARALQLPLDVFIVRKLGVPGYEELAMGALASEGIVVLNEDVVAQCSITTPMIDTVIAEETLELNRRLERYRGNKPFPNLKNKIIILVDDGIATGATIRVAIKALKQQHPAEIIIAVPVAPASTCKLLAPMVDKLVCPLKPDDLFAVGEWYSDFSQTTDEEVSTLLHSLY